MPLQQGNFLLDLLPEDILAPILPHLATVSVSQGEVLAESHQRIEKVYFPHSGIISCVVELAGGGAIETGMIGRDGVFGASQALDDKLSLNCVTIQVAGRMSVMTSDRFRTLVDQLPQLKALTTDYEQFLFAQAQQTAACNAIHSVESRTCKWLLRMHDLIGPELPLTHVFLAQMMGVRRTSVTTIAVRLQETGVIVYRRGHIRIANLERLKQSACECHQDLQSHYKRLFGQDVPTLPHRYVKR